MFRTFLARRLAHNVIAALVLATVLMGGMAMHERKPVRDLTPTLAEKLVATGKCWTVEAPMDMEGKHPGHAVVSDSTGHATYSRANVRLALEHVFEGKHPAITVYAFCR